MGDPHGGADAEMEYFALRKLWLKALLRGAVILPGSKFVVWNFAGQCENPFSLHKSAAAPAGTRTKDRDWVQAAYQLARVHGPWGTLAQGPPKQLDVVIKAPCWRCWRCLRRKARMWEDRAGFEASQAAARGARTWLGTLTCSPAFLYLCKSKALSHESYDPTEPDAEFVAIESEAYREVSLWLKRLRKGGARVRFLCVTEKTPPSSYRDGVRVENVNVGLPHYHILIHETDGQERVQWKQLSAANWPGGYVKFNVVDPDSPEVTYVCKYLSKSAAVCRYSLGYGRPDRGTPTPLVDRGLNKTLSSVAVEDLTKDETA